ncbi:hypothetical protein SODALDRAFT_330445 [Sodiomyces alkalinus F11]|uniref:Coupling of ubiquitin conjugation to ER degradation protein 1 n=1 Tax=Sodiomyces alkalinus (strain CBS 110278 / VKM F-3762 / F11) TaxID=1314773 RepID=A0A3N2Q1X3_SODAK|nr:hypothetical protein SODALDRAFT_330445 [Sodiomyces alkalinus F11]ROT40706.1 hypothetical protein SODALDRAFT_330445 [Sodiomyces alkalinus F11]
MANPDASQQISLPYLFVIVVLAGAILRFLFFSSNPAPPPRTNPLHVLRNRDAAVERIQQMFPQVDRRTILWDLQRNGGSVQATTERILAGRLETPPITFQPPPPIGGNNGRAAPTSAPAPKQPEKPSRPDLITRYRLHDKLQGVDASADDDRTGKGWSADRDERQAALKRRRDEMILQARKKMEAKIAAEKAGAAGKAI